MPPTKITYKIRDKDLTIEVVIGDIFSISGQKVIGTNNTFDTNLSNDLISPKSIQGQFTTKYFPSNINKLNDEIDNALKNQPYQLVTNPAEKDKRYDIGSVVKMVFCNETFYLLAMAQLNKHGTAESDLPTIRNALDKLWDYIAKSGTTDPIVIPLLGTKHGRMGISRKKMVEIHAESFLKASKSRMFSNKLTIVIWPEDAKRFGINLYEIEDYFKNHFEIVD